MLQRLCSVLLAFAFVTTASASTVGPQAVQQAVKELNFALNVQWDQKDQAFYKAQVEAFRTQISALQAQGMSIAEIIDASVSSVKDPQAANDLRQALLVVEADKLTLEEAQKFVLEAAKQSSSRGASWSGSTTYYIGVIIAIAIVVALVASSDSDSVDGTGTGGTGTDSGYSCGYRYDCSWGYDYWGTYGYNCENVWSCGYYF